MAVTIHVMGYDGMKAKPNFGGKDEWTCLDIETADGTTISIFASTEQRDAIRMISDMINDAFAKPIEPVSGATLNDIYSGIPF